MVLGVKGERDKKWVVIDASMLIAEHVHAFGGEIEDFREEIMRKAQEQLEELRNDAAWERSQDEKADRLGMRY